jgi:hypothetical protein
MRRLGLVLLTGGFFLPVVSLPAAEPAKDVNRIKALISQLGSDQFPERVAAGEALELIGEPALPLLQEALKNPDLEIRRWADQLIPRIEVRRDTAHALDPLRVRFTCKDLPVPQAVAEFARQTGHPINLAGDVNRMADRRITLDTGDTTFWDAFAQLCAKAGIHESEAIEQPQPNPDVYSGRVVRIRGGLARNVYYGNPRQPSNPTLVLEDGAGQTGAAVRNGSVRIRSIPPKSAVFSELPDGGKQIAIHLDVRTEARTDLTELIGIRITRATDPSGHRIRSATDYTENGPNAVMDPDLQLILMQQEMLYDGMNYSNLRQVPISVTLDGKPVETLGELSGVVSARVRTPPETLVTLADLSKAVGKTTNAADGSEVKVTECKREDDGLFKIKVELKSMQPATPEEQMLMARMGRIRGGRGVVMESNRIQLNKDNPDSVPFKLVNADGKPLQFVNGELEVLATNETSKVFTLVYKPAEKDTGPAKLEYIGRREVLVEVPFTLKDVPLVPKAK